LPGSCCLIIDAPPRKGIPVRALSMYKTFEIIATGKISFIRNVKPLRFNKSKKGKIRKDCHKPLSRKKYSIGLNPYLIKLTKNSKIIYNKNIFAIIRDLLLNKFLYSL
jgi:hypothetical protein